MSELILYDRERSGNCYRVRLMLSILGLAYKKIPIPRDGLEGNQLPPGFLALNPRGQVPVLLVDETAIWDSHAILIYLARRFGDGEWLPWDPQPLSRVMQWLALNLNEGTYGAARARSIRGMRRSGDLGAAQAMARVALRTLESRLCDQKWLAIERPTIADVACFPYTAMLPEAGVSLRPFPGVVRWIERIKAWPQYIALPPYDGKGGPLAE